MQSVGSIPSSNDRGVGQEVGAMDTILIIKLEDQHVILFYFKGLVSIMFTVIAADQFHVKFAVTSNWSYEAVVTLTVIPAT